MHAKIARLDPGLHVPSKEEEETDPAAADQCYESMVRMLRARTWGPKNHPMLFDQNLSYGFRRNLLGIRTIGTAACLIGVGSGATAVWLGHPSWPVVALSAAVGAFILADTPGDVRRQAERYARRLFMTGDLMKLAPASKASGSTARKNGAAPLRTESA
jgi:hypothetical protein